MVPYYIYSRICKKALVFSFNYIQRMLPSSCCLPGVRDLWRKKALPCALQDPGTARQEVRGITCLSSLPSFPETFPPPAKSSNLPRTGSQRARGLPSPPHPRPLPHLPPQHISPPGVDGFCTDFARVPDLIGARSALLSLATHIRGPAGLPTGCLWIK